MKKDEMITEQAKEISQLEELLDKAGTLISNWLRDDEPPNDRDADDIENEIVSQQISRQARDTWKIEEEPIEDTYTLVTWPDVQELMDEEWFEEEAVLEVEGKFGSSAYFVPTKRLL